LFERNIIPPEEPNTRFGMLLLTVRGARSLGCVIWVMFLLFTLTQNCCFQKIKNT